MPGDAACRSPADGHLPEARHGATHLGVTVSPLFDDDGDAARRDLPVHRPDRRQGARRAAAAEGEPGDGRRADRRHRARVPERAGDDSRLRQADRSRRRCPTHYRPYVEGIRAETESLGAGGHQLPELRAARRSSRCRGSICARSANGPPTKCAPRRGRSAATSTVRGEFGALEGDEVLLRQAFSNLLRNAVEACAGASLAPVVVVESEIDRGAAASSRIVVDDNGPGIEPARARSRLPAVLHLQAERHRPRPRAGAEDHRLSQRPHHRRHIAARRRQPSGDAADPRLAVSAARRPPHAGNFCEPARKAGPVPRDFLRKFTGHRWRRTADPGLHHARP